MKTPIVIVHYSEIALKKSNRIYFENTLLDNIRKTLWGTGEHRFQRMRGRIIIHLDDASSRQLISSRLKRVFGIAHFSHGILIAKEIDAMKQAALQLLESQKFDSFRIKTSRSQKAYPHTSTDVNQEVGAHVQEQCKKSIDLTHPDATCFIEITEKGALMYTEKIPGLRGLPVGVSEKAVSLLSSGIDSPVASFQMMKRGVKLVFVHFHSQPFTSAASQTNTEKLVEILSQFQYNSRLYLIPFIAIQKEIMSHAPERLRVLLYRRYMVRLAEYVARKEKAQALVTGENVGQVASQTLSNLRIVSEVTSLPILRPLAGYDKEEIIAMAQRMGTFEISTAPYEDCCSLFVPKNPETRALPQMMSDAETDLNLQTVMEDVLSRTEMRVYRPYNKPK